MKSLTGLKEFRNRAYCILGNGRDGLFDLMDAVITCRCVPSFAELSLSPVFRRQWSSLYKVLGRSQLPSEALMKLYSATRKSFGQENGITRAQAAQRG